MTIYSKTVQKPDLIRSLSTADLIIKYGATTLSKTTFSIMTLNIKSLNVILNMHITWHKWHSAQKHPECHYAGIVFVVMLNVIMLCGIMVSGIMLSSIMLSVVMLNVIMLRGIMLSFVMLNVIMLRGIMLSFVKHNAECHYAGAIMASVVALPWLCSSFTLEKLSN